MVAGHGRPFALRIAAPKWGIDGSQVSDHEEVGRIDQIVAYCKRGGRTTRAA